MKRGLFYFAFCVSFLSVLSVLYTANKQQWYRNYLGSMSNLLNQYQKPSMFGFGGLGLGLGYLAYKADNPWLRYGAGVGAALSAMPSLYAMYLYSQQREK